MTATVVKTLTINRRTLDYTLAAGGEIIQRGTLRHPRSVPAIAGYCKHIGYSVVLKGKATTMNTGKLSRKQREQIDANHFNALTEVVNGSEAYRLHAKTRRALIDRGFFDETTNTVTAAGRDFIAQAAPAPVVQDVVISRDPALPPFELQLLQPADPDYYDAAKQAHQARQALRELRDACLTLIESVADVKAPEMLPMIASIRRANAVLSDWE